MATEANTRRRSRDESLRAISGFAIDPHDTAQFTYHSSGNGNGKIKTITFKQGGTSGTSTQVVNIDYDASARIADIYLS